VAKRPKFDQKAEVRKLARERVGIVPASRPIEEKQDKRKKPKHKKPIVPETDE
jgi:hypothetical protein